jgi:hypothetical protein
MSGVYDCLRSIFLPPPRVRRDAFWVFLALRAKHVVSRRLQSRKTNRNRRKLSWNTNQRSPAKSAAHGRGILWLHSPVKARIFAGTIFVLHVAGLILLFSPVSGVIDSAAIIDQDWGLHFHHVQSMEQFWRQDKRIWGYNPLFMAGYPSNTIQDLSIKIFEFSALLLSSLALTSIQWFKLLAFLAVASVPWLVYFTARNFWHRHDFKTIAPPLAALFGTAYWWNSLPREMFFYGMIGFPTACYLALWGVSLVYRMAQQSAAWSRALLGWIIFAVIVPSFHVQTAIILFPPLAALLIVQPELLRSPFILWFLAAAALSLAVNLPWLIPAVSHLHDDMSRSIVEQLSLFVSGDPWTFLKDYFGPQSYWSFRSTWAEKGLRLTVLMLGALGVVHLLRSEQRILGVMLAAAAGVLFFISYFGSLLPMLKPWQPLRFKIAYDLFLVLAASYTIASCAHSRHSVPAPTVILTLIVGGAAFLFNLAATESLGKMQLRTQAAAEINAIVDWIKAETPANARVLFEESGDETGFVYDGMYLSSFVAHWTGRELIGGPINVYNDRHHFAEFHSGKLFKREIHRLSDEELRNYFRLYNIGAVVAFHPASVQRLQSVAGLVSLDRRIGPVHLMKGNQPFSWFLQGDGKVEAALGRIKVSDVKGREIVLKYHWVEGLKVVPPAKIFSVAIHDDPIPFIKIVDPPSTFSLQIGE